MRAWTAGALASAAALGAAITTSAIAQAPKVAEPKVTHRDERALAMGIHTPAADPKKVIWIESAPGTK